MMTKKTATSKSGSRKLKLKLKKETLKDLQVPSGKGVKGGMATGTNCQTGCGSEACGYTR
jgi:hypothetical protein